MIKKSKIYEAFRHSDIFNRDNVLMEVKAINEDSAREYFTKKFKVLGDTMPYKVRRKEE